jgi:hypothetical protein
MNITNKTAPSKRMAGLLLCLMAGCNTADDTGQLETLTLENTGYACLMDDGNDDTSTAAIQVTLDDCLSGCADSLSASCEASVADGSVVVTASGEYTVPTGDEVVCLSVCVELVANCDVSGITEDTTSFRYGEDVVDLDFPAEEMTCSHLDD